MPTNHVIAQVGYTLSWGPGTLRVLQYFGPHTDEDQKKSYMSQGCRNKGGIIWLYPSQ